MSQTSLPGGLLVMGVPVNQIRPFGTHWFVDPVNGVDGNSGQEVDRPFRTLTRAFVKVGDDDTIHLSGGNHTGNYETPLNAVASFVRVVGQPIGANGLRTWMGATVASSPIINVRARGWSFENIEFDCPTGSAGISLSKTVDGTERCDFTTIRNNIFTTGKYGIVVQGGGTHVHIHNNKFDQLTETGAFGLRVISTGFQIPAFWVVEDNIFATSLNHIGPGNATYGWSESTFRRNVHQSDSGTDATTICDVRAASGQGNMVLDNYFDIAKASFTADTTVRGNTTDFAAGNHFLDGEQQEAMNVS